MSERVWVVDEYCDAVREKDSEDVAIAHAKMFAFGHRTVPRVFTSKIEAVGFMVDRAEKRVKDAEASLRKEKARLKKNLKLLEVTQRSESVTNPHES